MEANSSNNKNNSGSENAVSSPSASRVEPVAAEASLEYVSSLLSTISIAEDETGPSNSNVDNHTAWNRPSNAAHEVGPAAIDPGPCPALSAPSMVPGTSTSSSVSLLNAAAPLYVSSQGTGTAISHMRDNGMPNSAPNSTMPTQKTSRRPNVSDNWRPNGYGPQPAGYGGSNWGPRSTYHAPRNHTQWNPQSRSPNARPHQYPMHNVCTNRNGVPNFRGNALQNPPYGARPNYNHANQEWMYHQIFNGRGAAMQPPRGVPFVPHLSTPPPVLPNPYLSFQPPPFVGANDFNTAHNWSFVPAPIYGNKPTMMPLHHAPDFSIHARIMRQLHYYFSEENLVTDFFLRQHMDDQGWVSIKLVATFHKISELTDNIQLILDSLRCSIFMEIQGEKIRLRNDWMKWILSPELQKIYVDQNANGSSIARSQADALNNLSEQPSNTRNGDLDGSSSAGNPS